VQSSFFTEVSDLIVVTISFLFYFFWCFFVFVCACVCVCMYVRAYLAIPYVSANDSVKHTKSNIRYDNKINK